MLFHVNGSMLDNKEFRGAFVREALASVSAKRVPEMELVSEAYFALVVAPNNEPD